MQCAIGREHLPRYAQAAELAIGVSRFNAAELAAAGARETAVVPNLVDLGRAPAPADPPGPERWLFVGRLVPHKRPDLVIRALALHGEATLTWVGSPISPTYAEGIRDYAQRVAPGRVTFESGLPDAELARRWREAHVFVCLSEHEGFCIPLLEAFHHGVPVVARAVTAVPEIAGDAALLVTPEDGLATVAEAARLAATDTGLREELRARGRARLQAFAPEAAARELRARLEAVAQ